MNKPKILPVEEKEANMNSETFADQFEQLNGKPADGATTEFCELMQGLSTWQLQTLQIALQSIDKGATSEDLIKIDFDERKKATAKEAALNTLANELFGIKRSITNASFLIQEITDEYFEKFTPGHKLDVLGNMAILAEFPRCKAYADLLEDCIHAVEKAINGLGITV